MRNSSRKAPRPAPARRSGMVMLVSGVCLWLGGLGLVHVITTNHIHKLGDEQRLVERQLADLDREKHSYDLKIEEALSRKNLMEKLSQHRTKLKALQPSNVIYVTVNPTPAPPSDEVAPLIHP